MPSSRRFSRRATVRITCRTPSPGSPPRSTTRSRPTRSRSHSPTCPGQHARRHISVALPVVHRREAHLQRASRSVHHRRRTGGTGHDRHLWLAKAGSADRTVDRKEADRVARHGKVRVGKGVTARLATTPHGRPRHPPPNSQRPGGQRASLVTPSSSGPRESRPARSSATSGSHPASVRSR